MHRLASCRNCKRASVDCRAAPGKISPEAPAGPVGGAPLASVDKWPLPPHPCSIAPTIRINSSIQHCSCPSPLPSSLTTTLGHAFYLPLPLPLLFLLPLFLLCPSPFPFPFTCPATDPMMQSSQSAAFLTKPPKPKLERINILCATPLTAGAMGNQETHITITRSLCLCNLLCVLGHGACPGQPVRS